MSAPWEENPNHWRCPAPGCGFGVFNVNAPAHPDDDYDDEDPVEEHLRNAHSDEDLDSPTSAPRSASKVSDIPQAALALVDVVLAERGFPSDPLPNVERCVETMGQVGDPRTGRPTLLGIEFAHLVGDLLARSRYRNPDDVPWRNMVPTDFRLLTLNGDDDADVQCFVLTSVGHDIGARCWPVTFPHDVVALGRSALGSARDRVRFLSEVVRTYCDAVRLVGDDVGALTELVRTLRTLKGILRDEIRPPSLAPGAEGHDQPCCTGDETSSSEPDRQQVDHDSPSLGVVDDPSVGEGPVGEAAARPADRVPPPERPQHDGGPYPFMLHLTTRTPWRVEFYADPEPPGGDVPFIDSVADADALLDVLRQAYDLGKTHGGEDLTAPPDIQVL